jgi:hypothetical protein
MTQTKNHQLENQTKISDKVKKSSEIIKGVITI